MTLGDITAKLVAKTNEFEASMDKAGKSVNSMVTGSEKTVSKIGGAFKTAGKVAGIATAAMGAGFVALMKTGVDFNAEIEQLQTSFEVMTGSADKAVELVDKLKTVGAETPYELAGLAKTTQVLMQYGMTADQAYNATVNLGDIAQGSADKMQSIALAYGQMSSAGKVNMQDIKQMINAGFNPLQAIAQMTGETMQQVTARYEDNKISVDEVTEAMKFASSEGGKYFGSMEKQSKTLAGQVSTLKDNFNMFAGTLAGGVTDSISFGVLPAINDLLSTLTTAYQEGGISGFATALGEGIANIASKIIEQAPVIVESAVSIIKSLIKGLSDNLPMIVKSAITIVDTLIRAIVDLLPVILQMGITIIVHLLEGLADTLPELIPLVIDMVLLLVKTLIENLPLIISAGIEVILAIIMGLIDAIPILIEYIPTIIESIVEAIILALPMIIVAGIRIIIELIKGLIGAIPMLVVMIPQIITAIAGAIVDAVPEMWKSGKELVKGLWQGIKDAGTWIKEKISGWVGSVNDFFKKKFGISSPSKIMEKEVGFNLGAGIAKGVQNSIGMIENAMQDVDSALATTVSPTISPNILGMGSAGSLSGLNISINMAGANITSSEVAQDYAEQIGDAIIGKLRTARRSYV